MMSSSSDGLSIRLEVTPQEQAFLDMLHEFQEESGTSPTQKDLRLVGGWVRDRLMGIQSHDIDIALEDCTGQQFAMPFERWLHGKKRAHRASTAIIKANSSRSKHLETAILTVPELELTVDFVNLRCEQYAVHSRIPTQVQFGTPFEDCMRRDLTINALFFNLKTREIEDWSGKGFNDLRNGVLRTPCAAEKTFLDDPLRVLRVVRFAAKLDRRPVSSKNSPPPSPIELITARAVPLIFQVDETVEKAARLPSVRAALHTKITKERCRQELQTLFTYPKISEALFLMHDWDLLTCIFADDSELLKTIEHAELLHTWTPLALLVEEVMRAIKHSAPYPEYISKSDVLMSTSYATEYLKLERRGVLVLSAMLVGHHRLGGTPTAATAVLHIIKSKNVANLVDTLLNLAEAFRSTSAADKETLRSILRMKGAAAWWEYALILALCLIHYDPVTPLKSSADFVDHPAIPVILAELVLWRTGILVTHKLAGIWDYKPLLNGNDVVRLLKERGAPYKPADVGDIMALQADYLISRWDPTVADQQSVKAGLLEFLHQKI